MSWRRGQSYSQDLRDRVFAAIDSGLSVSETARSFSVSGEYVRLALRRRRLTGETGVNPNRGHPARKLEASHEAALSAYVRDHPSLTLAQTRAWLLSEHGLSLSMGSLWIAMRRLGLSFKKSS